MIWIAVALIVVATYCDLRTREIPDWISVALVLVGIASAALGLHPQGWWGLAFGGALAFALGAAGFALGGLGGGDVKLCTGLGAVLGPWGLLSALFWVALAGGIMALVAASRGKKDLAYVPAITTGLLIYAIWPNATSLMLGL